MTVFARLAVLVIAAGLSGASVSPAHAHENEALKHIQKAVKDVFSGKTFEEAMQQVREARQRHALKAAGYDKNLPFYVPGPKDIDKPAEIRVRTKKPVVAIAIPRKKPFPESPQARPRERP